MAAAKKKNAKTKEKRTVKKTKKPSEPFPVVAIGASAGGLEAVTQLLTNLSPETGMAFVYIQHLDPTHESMLTSLLSKVTKMKVVEAAHMMKMQPNHFYIIPPNKELFAVDSILKVLPRKKDEIKHMPIDSFFISLAQEERERAIGVLLSGTASDGTAGLKAIKIAGGFTIVQNETAKFQSMPRSAVAEGVVDLVLSPKEIAVELESRGSNGRIDPDYSIKDNDQSLMDILALLKRATGVDFTHYKVNTIKRRIIRRMMLHRIEKYEEYVLYLREHADEVNLLYKELLINVTSFFRDADTTEYLKQTLLPRLLKPKAAGDVLRIWVPACATGEEAYSLGMLLTEIMGESPSVKVQIFATDLSEPAIAKARFGLYTKNDLLEISPKRLQRFFIKQDGSYRIIKPIREMCVFAPHNIFKDPPFSYIDLVSCCNLLIYLDTVLQRKVLGLFHYALNENGYLLLGKSESIGGSTRLFSQADKRIKVFARKNDPGTRMRFDMSSIARKEREIVAGQKPSEKKSAAVKPTLEKTVDDLLLSKYIPASVVINEDFEITQFRGSTGFFLEPSPGKASLNLIKMARPGLGFEFRTAINKAIKTGKPVKKEHIEIQDNGVARNVRIEVVPLAAENGVRYFLVMMEEIPAQVTIGESSATKNSRINKLEQELAAAREDMRSIIEQGEVAYEELQTANEEVVSSNEELQSINEELETSKEELESTNEELITVNHELQTRNEQLSETQEYNESILETVREAMVILDEGIRVKTANRSFYKIFRVSERETEGRLLFELGSGQWEIPKLRELLYDIIPKNTIFNDFEVVHNFPGLGEKTLLLNARKLSLRIHREELILLAIEDVSEFKRSAKLNAQRDWYRNMADNAPAMIWISGPDKKFTYLNETWLDYTGRSLDEEIGDGWMEGLHPEDLERWVKTYNAAVKKRAAFQLEYRLRREDKKYRWLLMSARPTFSPDGEFTGYIGTGTEIHDKKIMQEELEKKVQDRTTELVEANASLKRSNDELQQFAYVASHDLQEPLRKIITFVDRLQKKYDEEFPDEAKDFMGRIVESSKRMSRLIEDLLNFSRASRSSEKYATVDLELIVKNILKDFDLIIQQKNAEINIGKLPVLKAVPVQMAQLFHNLVSNALKFTYTKMKPVINISSHRLSEKEAIKYSTLNREHGLVEITISDNGIGFRPEFAEQIFNIFQRLHGKSEYPGTGIGLALCRKIVENHNGIIYARSKEKKGATFHVILPLQQ